MGKKYIANAFSISMIPNGGIVDIEKLSKEEFCEAARSDGVQSAIGHEGTTQFVNQLCNSNLKTNRIAVTLEAGTELYIVQLLARLPEGKILTAEQMKSIPVSFYRVTPLTLR